MEGLTMSVYSFTINFPGQNNGVTPRIGHLFAPDNTLAEVTTAGYLDRYIKEQNFSVLHTDIIAVRASNGAQFYKPIFTAGSCTLEALP